MGAAHSAERIQSVRDLAEEGMTDRDIGERLDLTRAAVEKIRRNHGIPPGKVIEVAPEVIKLIQSMAAEGALDAHIGEVVGMSKVGVQAVRKRRGITAGRKIPSTSHGTTSMYNSGCRCDDCMACKRELAKEYRRKRTAKARAGEATFAHGKSGYLNWGCRCETCSTAHAEACRAYGARRRTTDPEKTREQSRAWRDANRAQVRVTANERYRGYQRETIDRAEKHNQEWTSAELEVVSRTDISMREMAYMLGRTWNAVRKQRQKMRDAERGEVGSHGLGGYGRGCRCAPCVENKAEYRRGHAEKVHQETAPEAGNTGKQWTGPELEVASRKDLSVKEIALLLGRSYAAVSAIRYRIYHDPKTINFAGIPEGGSRQAGDAGPATETSVRSGQ